MWIPTVKALKAKFEAYKNNRTYYEEPLRLDLILFLKQDSYQG